MVAVGELSTDSGLMSGSDRAYVVGRIQPVLEKITISEFFSRTVSLYPDREACVFCSVSATILMSKHYIFDMCSL